MIGSARHSWRHLSVITGLLANSVRTRPQIIISSLFLLEGNAIFPITPKVDLGNVILGLFHTFLFCVLTIPRKALLSKDYWLWSNQDCFRSLLKKKNFGTENTIFQKQNTLLSKACLSFATIKIQTTTQYFIRWHRTNFNKTKTEINWYQSKLSEMQKHMNSWTLFM